MLSLKHSKEDIRSRSLSSSSRQNDWIRLRSTSRSPYGTLLYFGNVESPSTEKPAVEAGLGKESRKYTVKIGQQIFQSDDPKALVKLAVAARRTRS